MCTNIATKTRVTGSATLDGSWGKIDEATIGFDHATHLWAEHAVRIDFANSAGSGRVAVELDLASGRALLRELEEVIAAADASGVEA